MHTHICTHDYIPLMFLEKDMYPQNKNGMKKFTINKKSSQKLKNIRNQNQQKGYKIKLGESPKNKKQRDERKHKTKDHCKCPTLK